MKNTLPFCCNTICLLSFFVITIAFIVIVTFPIFAQNYVIQGKITIPEAQEILHGVVALQNTKFQIQTDKEGNFRLDRVPAGAYTFIAFCEGKKTFQQHIILQADIKEWIIPLQNFEKALESLTITAERERTFGLTRLDKVENFGIYEGKKTEVIVIKDITANLATNNARQVYARITGLNIWESDQAGLQLGIGGRGLSPNRTANFNVRQNGYDISADALGYPESYYTPPVEALERIEVVRGAASLQYGTQFGGMLNFRFKQAPKDKNVEFVSRQSVGSWGFWSSFNSLSGSVGKFSYYTYYQHKTGQGYRPNSGFQYHNFFTNLRYQITPKLQAEVEITHMNYLAQQAGGLTDRHFQENARQSLRERNWFKVNWNLIALNITHKFSEKTQLNIRNFGLMASRSSVGNLERINMADFGQERTLIEGRFDNIGNETRLLHHYIWGKQKHTFLAGTRFYQGRTTARQGFGSRGRNADFQFLNPNDVEDSDFVFPNQNYAFFIENIWQLGSQLSLTPGIRVENIRTAADGYYKRYVTDGAGNIIVQNRINEQLNRVRSFVLAGIGLHYKPSEQLEIYANISQNYRAINFTDLRINNPNLRVDANIRDEKGYTADIGIRGRKEDFFNYEITFFYLHYFGKIGQILRTDTLLFNDYRFRTNIANARNIGIEMFAELAPLQMLGMPKETLQWQIFANFAYINARYIRTEDRSLKDRKVEMVPPLTLKMGNTLKWRKWAISLQYSYVAEHFSDASNTRRTATAIEGIIPTYQVWDLSLSYAWKKFRWEGTINNLLNEQYFTRRADAYPGPGIIPADGRAFYTTLQIKI